MLSPRQLFEDNIRPAELLLRVYRLLENESLATDGDMVQALRGLVKAESDEGLMLIYNELFLGLVRERAQMPPSTLKQSALQNLLRQAVVAACTAQETYLPALLQTKLPTVIDVMERDFVPRDKETVNYFRNMTFNLTEVLRILAEPDPLFIANKMIGFAKFSYLSAKRGIHVTGSLLGVEEPWKQISDKLCRDEADLVKTVDETTNRRNNIVHRADRSKSELDGAAQPISFSWTKHSVDTISAVCLALDELVQLRIQELSKSQVENVTIGEGVRADG